MRVTSVIDGSGVGDVAWSGSSADADSAHKGEALQHPNSFSLLHFVKGWGSRNRPRNSSRQPWISYPVTTEDQDLQLPEAAHCFQAVVLNPGVN